MTTATKNQCLHPPLTPPPPTHIFQAPSLSEQQLIDCDRGPPFDDLGCAGGSVEGAVAYISKNGGLDSEADYPYTGVDASCRKRRASHVVASVDGYVKVRKRSEAQLRAAVARRPVAVAVCCGDYIDDWHAYTGGIMKFNGSEVREGRERGGKGEGHG